MSDLSSGDAIACIGMALQNPDTDEWPQLLRDCMHVIERMEEELLDAKRQRNAEVKLRQAAERSTQAPTDALAAGDVIAHQLLYRDHGAIIERWWQARGGHAKCSICNADNGTAATGDQS